MAPYHPPTGARRNKLRLDFNENTVGAPPHVIDFIKRYLTAADLSMYPEYENALEDLAVTSAWRSDELTLTNGTDEAIQLPDRIPMSKMATRCSCFVPPTPCIASMRNWRARLSKSSIIARARWPSRWKNCSNEFNPDTRAILISNPNNPTGTGIDPRAIEKILDKAPHAAVLIDEAYYEFSGITVLPLLRRLPESLRQPHFLENLWHGRHALRLSVSQTANIAHVRKAQSPYSVNTRGRHGRAHCRAGSKIR